MRKQQVQFTPISLEEIPGRLPVTPIASDRTGSQWDDALRALRASGTTHGIKVAAANKQQRQRLKSTLQTIAKSHAMPVEVLDDRESYAFFAWLSDREGRFAGPSGRNAE
jgi:hypothetical protein